MESLGWTLCNSVSWVLESLTALCVFHILLLQNAWLGIILFLSPILALAGITFCNLLTAPVVILVNVDPVFFFCTVLQWQKLAPSPDLLKPMFLWWCKVSCSLIPPPVPTFLPLHGSPPSDPIVQKVEQHCVWWALGCSIPQ